MYVIRFYFCSSQIPSEGEMSARIPNGVCKNSQLEFPYSRMETEFPAEWVYDGLRKTFEFVAVLLRTQTFSCVRHIPILQEIQFPFLLQGNSSWEFLQIPFAQQCYLNAPGMNNVFIKWC